jgi:DNA-binding response OmpR family regulator
VARIAWIEDDVDVIDSVVYPLEQAGYHIDRYRTTSEAKSHWDELRKVDLILLDMISPSGEGRTSGGYGTYPGLQLLQELRNLHELRIPVVAFTVVTKREVLEELKRLGVADIIRKPVRPSELKERIEAVLRSAHGTAP